MEFIITRTSMWYDETSNDEYIKQLNIPKGFSTNIKYLKPKGSNKKWRRAVVKIDTIEQLMEFYKKTKNEIVLKNDVLTDLPALEIYDDYRE